jgi:DNA helicase-2/ATP-dependent DNA helicase PcrA
LVAYKAKHNLMDYTDMLSEFVAQDHDAGLKKLFVDEAQDLSALQWSVVQLLSRSCDRVVVAGDDDQAIYPWAGADVEHLIEMDGEVRVLGQSFRCPPVIQDLSSKIITPIKNRRQKKWKAREGEPGVIANEGSFGRVDIGGDGSVLILARNDFVLKKQVEPVLRAEGVLYERKGTSSIKPSNLRAIVSWETLRRGDAVPLCDVRKMYGFISSGSGVKRGYKELKTYGDNEDEPVTMNDLVQTGGLLVNPTTIWHDALDKMPRDDMSYMLAALRRGEKLRGERPRVRLSTIHSAKGGEADHVVLMREMAERSFAEMRDKPDDERRVWFVAVTRARQKLTMVASETHRECPWV